MLDGHNYKSMRTQVFRSRGYTDHCNSGKPRCLYLQETSFICPCIHSIISRAGLVFYPKGGGWILRNVSNNLPDSHPSR
jgi:hypothetical protein